MKQVKISIHRTRIGKDIVAEFAIPSTEKLRRKGMVAIIAKGLPGMPGSATFLEFLARKGFYAILPRYRGTWESGGELLKDEPTKDILDVLEEIKKPLQSFYEGREYTFPKSPKIYLFVASFGGPAGLLLSRHKEVKRVFAYAPVVDWQSISKKEPLKDFYTHTKQIYGEAYRTKPQSWKKLAHGTFYNPSRFMERIAGEKVIIFHANDDDIVPSEPVKRFAERVKATYIGFKEGGHGGTSSFMEPRVWRKIIKEI